MRWSLADAAPGVGERLREYVAGTSHARFSAMEALRFKTWRMREGEWFEGCYVFATPADRGGVPGDVHGGRGRVTGLADHRLAHRS